MSRPRCDCLAGDPCTCAPRPAEPPGELRDDEWWLRLFHVTSEAVDFVPYAAASEYPVPHVAAFRAAAEPLLAPLLDAQATWRELLRQVVMDWVPKCDVPDCTCSAHRARRALDGPL